MQYRDLLVSLTAIFCSLMLTNKTYNWATFLISHNQEIIFSSNFHNFFNIQLFQTTHKKSTYRIYFQESKMHGISILWYWHFWPRGFADRFTLEKTMSIWIEVNSYCSFFQTLKITSSIFAGVLLIIVKSDYIKVRICFSSNFGKNFVKIKLVSSNHLVCFLTKIYFSRKECILQPNFFVVVTKFLKDLLELRQYKNGFVCGETHASFEIAAFFTCRVG